MKRYLYLVPFVLLAASAGCGDVSLGGLGATPDCVKPTIAVMKFENRSTMPLGWDIGGGMKDVLVDRLCSTGKFQVIERPELDLIMKELRFQQTGATRKHNRAKLGQIKNVQYLIKGTVTDFGPVSTKSGYLSWADNLDIFGTGHRAVMGMTMYVVDVESGEIVCSESIEESVSAKDVNVSAAYKGVGFGGSTFFRTPLGRATAKVIDKAVKRVAKSIAARPWQPKVAQVVNDTTVIINGGKDRRMSVGDEYEVVETGEPIVDPDTGDVLGTPAGDVVGLLHVSEVHKAYSVALIVGGEASKIKVGQSCRPAKQSVPVTGDASQVQAGGDFLSRVGLSR